MNLFANLKFKHIQSFLTLLLSFFMLLNFFNSYIAYGAVDPVQIDIKKGWGDADLITCAKNGMGIADCIKGTVASTGRRILAGIVIDATPTNKFFLNAQKEIDSSDLPELAKKDTLQNISDNTATMLQSQPSYNVVAQLKQDWIPGESKTGSVYAASSGYDYLNSSGIAVYWGYARTIAYLLFVVIIVIAGFMIMFRQKIGGQVAVTVYNTLPNVILGLILVTFSFAIVGLILNFSAVLTNVVASLVGGASSVIYPDGWFAWAKMLFNGGSAIVQSDAAWMDGLTAGVSATLILLGGTWILLLIVIIVLIFIYIFAFFKLYIECLKVLVSILIDTIAGPVIIALSVFPGNSKMLVGWFNRLIKGALFFPIVLLIINIPTVLITTDVEFDVSGLTRGTLTPVSGLPFENMLIYLLKMFLPLAALYFAAEVPKILEEYFPSHGSQGLNAALQGAQGNLAKIPLIGSLFKASK